MNKMLGITIGVLLALTTFSPVIAATPGDLTVKTSAVARDKNSITLRLTYHCTKYIAPYDNWDIIGANIFSSNSTGYYSTITINPVTCDNFDHRLVLNLISFNGGFTGSGMLSIGHQGMTFDGSGYVNEYGSVNLPIKVK
jgi:hypothetical protein